MTRAMGLPGMKESYVEAGGSRLRVFAGGEGPPLLLVHGLSGSAANFVELAPRLSPSFRLLVPDLPGHGGSAPLRGVESLEPFAACLAGLLEREEAGPAAVVGHSLGGVLGVRLALMRPDLVRALVLVSAAGIATASVQARAIVTALGHLRPGRLVAPLRGPLAGSAWFRTLCFQHFFVADAPALSALAVHGLLAGHVEHADVRTAGQALLREDVRGDLDRVACPALVVWGARDTQVPVGDALAYARRLRAPLRVIAGCGHLPIVERPDAVADAVLGFL